MDPWRWIRPRGSLRYEYNATLTFVRGVDDAGIVEAFDADPTSRRLLTWVEAEQTDFPHYDWLRVADLGDWLVAEEPNSVRATVGEAGMRLGRSAPEVFGLSFVLQDGLTTYGYWRDGSFVTGSEIGFRGQAGTADPSRFDAAFEAAGMTDDPAASLADRVGWTLTAVARETGISLPAEVLEGQLPTYAFRNPPPY